VRTEDGGVEVDVSGKKKGRGAYLCPSKECWEAGLGNDRLEYSLKISLTPDNRERLAVFGQNL